MATWLNEMIPAALFGVDARLETGKKLKGYGCKRVLLFADELMVQMKFADELVKCINDEGIEAEIFEVKMGEPTAQRCDAAYEELKDKEFDGVVGLGGGATMDLTKVVCKLFANGGKTDDYMGYGNPAGNTNYAPLIELPTTAGTGSEVNTGAMCTSSNGNKGAVAQLATLAIIDPVYTYSVPAAVTAFTGVDALGHLTENLFNTENQEQLISDMMAMRGIETVFKWLPEAYKDGSNKEARKQMSYAALLGGYCMRVRKLTFGHSMANQFSDKYHLPHGICAGLGLAAVVRYGVQNIPSFTRQLACALGIAVPENGDLKEVGAQIVKKYDELLKSLGMKSMKEHGMEKEFIETMVENIKGDTKWKIMTPPDFDLMKQAMYDAYDY